MWTIRHRAAVEMHELFQVHISILLGFDTLLVGNQTWTFWGSVMSSSFLLSSGHFNIWRWGHYIAWECQDLITHWQCHTQKNWILSYFAAKTSKLIWFKFIWNVQFNFLRLTYILQFTQYVFSQELSCNLKYDIHFFCLVSLPFIFIEKHTIQLTSMILFQKLMNLKFLVYKNNYFSLHQNFISNCVTLKFVKVRGYLYMLGYLHYRECRTKLWHIQGSILSHTTAQAGQQWPKMQFH
jgi:hypothetical protein